jgi:hypothetical protein
MEFEIVSLRAVKQQVAGAHEQDRADKELRGTRRKRQRGRAMARLLAKRADLETGAVKVPLTPGGSIGLNLVRMPRIEEYGSGDGSGSMRSSSQSSCSEGALECDYRWASVSPVYKAKKPGAPVLTTRVKMHAAANSRHWLE